jgi:hypothetical protein
LVFELDHKIRCLELVKVFPQSLVFVLLEQGHAVERRRSNVEHDQTGVVLGGKGAGQAKGPFRRLREISRVKDGFELATWEYSSAGSV